MTTMNISLTPALAGLVQSKVASGLYNNASEVIRDALRQLDTNAELLYELKKEKLRQVLQSGLQQYDAGDHAPYPLSQLMADVARRNRDDA